MPRRPAIRRARRARVSPWSLPADRARSGRGGSLGTWPCRRLIAAGAPRPAQRARGAGPAAGERARGRRAGRWCCAARPGSARPRCWSTWPSARRGCADRSRGGRRVRDRARVRRAAAAVRAVPRPARRLPGPQRDALGTAFGLRDGDAPDRFLRRPGGAEPARRRGRGAAAGLPRRRRAVARPRRRRRRSRSWRAGCGAESVGSCSPCASAGEQRRWTGCRSSSSAGSATSDARRCSASAVAGPLDARVRDRIVAETHGNPLALLELPRPVAARAGGRVRARRTAPTSPRRIVESFQRRLAALPADTRPLLLVAAVRAGRAPSALIWARGRSGSGSAPRRRGRPRRRGCASSRAVRFRHPLVRSAVYRAARRRSGAPCTGPSRTSPTPAAIPIAAAWHRATAPAAATRRSPPSWSARPRGPRARGGARRRRRLPQRAAELTPAPARRARRALAAAEAKHHAGAPDDGAAAARDAPSPLDELRAGALLRAQIAFAERAAATLRRCCSRRPGGWSRWTRARARDLPGRVRRGALG